VPAKTEKQRKMMAIAEHQPSKLYKRNRGVLKMSHKQLHEFASKKKGKAHIPGGSEHPVQMKGSSMKECQDCGMGSKMMKSLMGKK